MAITLDDIQKESDVDGEHKLVKFVFTIELVATTDLLDADRKTPAGLTEEQLLTRLIEDTKNDVGVKNPSAIDIFKCLDGWQMFDEDMDNSDGNSMAIVRSNVSLELKDLNED